MSSNTNNNNTMVSSFWSLFGYKNTPTPTATTSITPAATPLTQNIPTPTSRVSTASLSSNESSGGKHKKSQHKGGSKKNNKKQRKSKKSKKIQSLK
jgi:hypothetical protein